MKPALWIGAVAILMCGAWIFWPQPKPIQVCEDALNSSILDCDMTKGHLK